MPTSDAIIIVSGLPRSGTSMMMNMLQAGGIELLVDGIRTADEDNPKGYFELERVKKLKEDTSWLKDAKGKVIKAISQLLYDLPTDGSYRYKVVFVRRDLDELLASQKKMLIRRGTHKAEVKDEDMRRMFLLHLEEITAWLAKQPCFEVLYVNYNRMLADPADKIAALNRFLGGDLDVAAMGAAIDQALYRNRARADSNGA